MSTPQEKAKNRKLSAGEAKNAAAFQLHVERLKNDEEWAKRMSDKLNDKKPGAWFSIEEAEERLGLK